MSQQQVCNMHRLFRFLPEILVGTALFVSGCGSSTSGEKTYPVSGTVQFEGEPVAAGEIIFFPADPALRPNVGTIRDGDYRFEAKAGPARVEIRASKPTGKMLSPPPGESGNSVPEMKSYLPAAYNTDSKLSVTVSENPSENTFDFQLNQNGDESNLHSRSVEK